MGGASPSDCRFFVRCDVRGWGRPKTVERLCQFAPVVWMTTPFSKLPAGITRRVCVFQFSR